MPTVTANELKIPYFEDYAPIGRYSFGNYTVIKYQMDVSSGVFTASNKTTALAASDEVILGELPKGALLIDAKIITTVGLGEKRTLLDVGFKYTDGKDLADPAENSAYFYESLPLKAAVNVSAKEKIVPIVLPKSAYLTVAIKSDGLKVTADGSLIVYVFCVKGQIY